MEPATFDLLVRLGLALGVGLVVGVERGWRQRDEPAGGRTAGVRTFALIGFLGGLSGAISLAAGTPLPWIACLVLLTAVFAVFSLREGLAEDDFSVTNVVTAMTVFLLGVLAVQGDIRLAAAGGVVTAALLASREHLHRAVSRLSWMELRSALLLLAMTVVVLPLLPDRPIDPLGALNPSELWLLMILTAGVSYAGYVALKIAGPEKGPPLAGLAGGLASSTATTLAMSRLSRKVDDTRGLAAGVSFAAMVSVLRATGLALIVQPALAPMLMPPACAAAIVLGGGGAVSLVGRRSDGSPQEDLGVPFELRTVFGFGVLLAIVMFVGAWIAREAGSAGAYAFSAVSGFVDVDAITLSMARSVTLGSTPSVAGAAILIALASNAVQRVVFSWVFGSRTFALRFTIVSALALAAGTLLATWTIWSEPEAQATCMTGAGSMRTVPVGPSGRAAELASMVWLQQGQVCEEVEAALDAAFQCTATGNAPSSDERRSS